jgi:hypothetical protein
MKARSYQTAFCCVKSGKLLLKFAGMMRLDSGLASGFEELFYPGMSE